MTLPSEPSRYPLQLQEIVLRVYSSGKEARTREISTKAANRLWSQYAGWRRALTRHLERGKFESEEQKAHHKYLVQAADRVYCSKEKVADNTYIITFQVRENMEDARILDNVEFEDE